MAPGAFSSEVDAGSREENALATAWSFALGHLVLAADATLYPDQEITLRQAGRGIARRETPE